MRTFSMPSSRLFARVSAPVVAVTLLAATLSFSAVGCSDKKLTIGEVRGDMTPALMTTARTQPQQDNKNARIIDNNARGFWDDLDRVLFNNRNSYLTPYPMP